MVDRNIGTLPPIIHKARNTSQWKSGSDIEQSIVEESERKMTDEIASASDRLKDVTYENLIKDEPFVLTKHNNFI